MIIDFTECLKSKIPNNHKIDNLHIFNPSTLNTEEYEIYTYRTIISNSDKKQDPKDFWDDLFSGSNMPVTPTIETLGSQNEYLNQNDTSILYDPKTYYYDSTAIIINNLKTGESFSDIRPFKNNMTDVRVQRIGDDVYLTGNIYLNGNLKMIRRKLNLTKPIYFGPEESVIPSAIKERQIEKNCVYSPCGTFNYDIDGRFIFYKDGLKTQDISLFQHLKNQYGSSNIFFSLGTPPISYNEKEYLSVGHIKIDHVKCYSKYDFKSFSFNKKFVGKYVYFMFIFLIDKESGYVTRISEAFIPTMPNNYNTIVFPCGNKFLNDWELQISYGEGDVSCKSLVINRAEIRSMLTHKPNEIKKYDFKFLVFSPDVIIYKNGIFYSEDKLTILPSCILNRKYLILLDIVKRIPGKYVDYLPIKDKIPAYLAEAMRRFENGMFKYKNF